jgi:hypothetical protein
VQRLSLSVTVCVHAPRCFLGLVSAQFMTQYLGGGVQRPVDLVPLGRAEKVEPVFWNNTPDTHDSPRARVDSRNSPGRRFS